MAEQPESHARRVRKKFAEEMNWNKVLARPGKHSFIVVLDHLKPTYNIGKIFRACQAMGAAGIHLVGIPQFNPFPANGAVRYVPLRQFESMEESLAALEAEGFTAYALDPGGDESLPTSRLAERAAFLLGHEEHGFSIDLGAHPSIRRMRIPMEGGVESINVSIAATLAMYEFTRQRSRDI